MTKAFYSLVGMKHRGTEGLVKALPAGEALTLIRESNNKHDSSAVQVWGRGQHLGYVKATQVHPIAVRLDALIERTKLAPKAVLLPGKLTFDGGGWPMIEIEETP